MSPRSPSRKPPRPLDEARLEEMAVAYVGRFATTRAKLATYLARKLRERGWEAPRPPAIEALVEKLARLGYVDDAAFALAKARSLGSRGYGRRRVTMALRQAGVGEEDGRAAHEASGQQAVTAALRFAQRKRIGPFALARIEPKEREKALATMLRAGHDFELSRRVLDLAPGSVNDPSEPVEGLSDDYR